MYVECVHDVYWLCIVTHTLLDKRSWVSSDTFMMTAQVITLSNNKMISDKWIGGCGRLSCSSSRYHPTICLEGLKKIKKTGTPHHSLMPDYFCWNCKLTDRHLLMMMLRPCIEQLFHPFYNGAWSVSCTQTNNSHITERTCECTLVGLSRNYGICAC
jgi:hypothetical protein